MRFLKWLAQYNKAFVPVVMAIITIINAKYGVEIPLSEVEVALIVGTITSFLTWLIPNVKKGG